MRVLFWLAVVIVAVLWLQHAKKARLKARSTQRPAEAGDRVEEMVQCALCGVHVPASEAIGNSAEGVFCSEEHRVRHRRA